MAYLVFCSRKQNVEKCVKQKETYIHCFNIRHCLVPSPGCERRRVVCRASDFATKKNLMLQIPYCLCATELEEDWVKKKFSFPIVSSRDVTFLWEACFQTKIQTIFFKPFFQFLFQLRFYHNSIPDFLLNYLILLDLLNGFWKLFWLISSTFWDLSWQWTQDGGHF